MKNDIKTIRAKYATKATEPDDVKAAKKKKKPTYREEGDFSDRHSIVEGAQSYADAKPFGGIRPTSRTDSPTLDFVGHNQWRETQGLDPFQKLKGPTPRAKRAKGKYAHIRHLGDIAQDVATTEKRRRIAKENFGKNNQVLSTPTDDVVPAVNTPTPRPSRPNVVGGNVFASVGSGHPPSMTPWKPNLQQQAAMDHERRERQRTEGYHVVRRESRGDLVPTGNGGAGGNVTTSRSTGATQNSRPVLSSEGVFQRAGYKVEKLDQTPGSEPTTRGRQRDVRYTKPKKNVADGSSSPALSGDRPQIGHRREIHLAPNKVHTMEGGFQTYEGPRSNDIPATAGIKPSPLEGGLQRYEGARPGVQTRKDQVSSNNRRGFEHELLLRASHQTQMPTGKPIGIIPSRGRKINITADYDRPYKSLSTDQDFADAFVSRVGLLS